MEKLLQTGSGKTYTMGTGFRNGYQTGIVPQVMTALFEKIESMKHETDFQLHVSYIEVHSVWLIYVLSSSSSLV